MFSSHSFCSCICCDTSRIVVSNRSKSDIDDDCHKSICVLRLSDMGRPSRGLGTPLNLDDYEREDEMKC